MSPRWRASPSGAGRGAWRPPAYRCCAREARSAASESRTPARRAWCATCPWRAHSRARPSPCRECPAARARPGPCRYGEDGTVQGALELLGIPYTGSGVLASALAMDKWRTKLVWQACGIPTPRSELLARNSDMQAVATRLGLPLMVKPANEGSSIGMTKVKSARELPEAYALAANYDRVVIAEAFVEGVELTAGILGDKPLPLIKLETPREFYDYEAKYQANDTRYLIPCGLPPDAERIVQDEALFAFETLGCRGW